MKKNHPKTHTLPHPRIIPHLWFNSQVREAAEFYTSVFSESAIQHQLSLEGPPGVEVELVWFSLRGTDFMAIGAPTEHTFNHAISLVVECHTQEEIDYYWEQLSSGGKELPCGWLCDRFGISWQVLPALMNEVFLSGDSARIARLTSAMLKMMKIDLGGFREL